MRVLIVDNLDSFTWNLAQVLAGLGAEVEVRRAGSPPAELLALAPDRVVLSPGPGHPDDAVGCREALDLFAEDRPLLGVCLGLQVLARSLGARVERVEPRHGRASSLEHDGLGMFAGLPSPIVAGRYHSLAVVEESLPPELLVTARAEDGVVMGLRHAWKALSGVQFHPESVLTPDGARMLERFLDAP